MKYVRAALFLLLVSVPLASNAGVATGAFPGTTVWYLHADLDQMRSTESGGALYAWLDGEVFVDINEEFGININKETDWVTAFSSPESGTVIIVAGEISSESQDKILAVAADEGKLDTREYRNKTYYLVGDESAAAEQPEDPLGSIESSAFFSFAVKGKLLVTSSEAQLKELIDSGGKVSGAESHDGALFVLSAEKTFVQAGLKMDELADDDDDDWDSNIIRNTEQAALMVSDMNGMIAVEAQLVSADARFTASIGGIVNGLISLQAFNPDLDPEIVSLLQNTKIEVNDKILSISTVIPPEIALAVLNDK